MVAKKSGGSASKDAGKKPAVKKSTVKDLTVSRQKGSKVKGGDSPCAQTGVVDSCGATATCINCSVYPVC